MKVSDGELKAKHIKRERRRAFKTLLCVCSLLLFPTRDNKQNAVAVLLWETMLAVNLNVVVIEPSTSTPFSSY